MSHILVDSSSPDIQYAGDWIVAASTDDMKNPTKYNGAVLSDNLYGAPEGKTVALLYKFTGAASLNVHGVFNSLETDPAIWEVGCEIEPRGPNVVTLYNVSMRNVTGYENDYRYCQLNHLTLGESYVFNFTAKITRGTPVWFDGIELAVNPDDSSPPHIMVYTTSSPFTLMNILVIVAFLLVFSSRLLIRKLKDKKSTIQPLPKYTTYA